ncbi:MULTISPECIES: histidine phosphatase family protein [Staphylococcaceae]|uniref:histidine phosphatase family protein n=1 Tax=Staphylococcaceae TaxID=90964 RepID=UPI00105935D1|nr:histidine phosphatase family protein [Macrococcus bohemicus]TDL38291.1 histidine phosphatase family protein [Macrococcus bohemicus]
MKKSIYLVRHAESTKSDLDERNRGLTLKGVEDVNKVTQYFENINVSKVYSSPYKRAIDTVKPLSINKGLDVSLVEDLKECVFSNHTLQDSEVYPLVEKLFDDKKYKEQGESLEEVQIRGISIIQKILKENHEAVVIGTHGVIMTAILNYFDNKYDYKFLRSTSKPDIYEMVFDGCQFVDCISRNA